MFCSQCGTELEMVAKFCSTCGNRASDDLPPVGPTLAEDSKLPEKGRSESAESLRTKWLTFWSCVSLPLGGVLGLLLCLALFVDSPIAGMILIPLPALYLIVAYGLQYRRSWGWKLNWVIIILAWLVAAVPDSVLASPPEDGVAFLGEFAARAFVGLLIWMWPNNVYWTKRRALFS